MGNSKLSRRGFLKGAAITAAGAAVFPYIVRSSALGVDGKIAASNRITLGFIGVGHHGTAVNLNNFLSQPDTQVVAICDVDADRLEKAERIVKDHYAKAEDKQTHKGCATYKDFREIIARKDIDAVVISTPDHWHVLPAVAAARVGKDVFCEKPLTLTVYEGRFLSDTIERYERVFQTASENRSKSNFLRACELVRNGRIGKLHTLCTVLPEGYSIHGDYGKIQKPQAVPEGFDYDMWLGQAPQAPYAPGRCHFNFRWILDYSGGMLTDWGAHLNDIAQWANDTEYTGPVSVDGHGVFPADGLYNTATEWEIGFEYANGVKLICKSGDPNKASVRFEGTDGWVFCEWNSIEASSQEILKSVIGPDEIHLRTCRNREQRDFLDCVKSRQDTYAPAEVGHRTATLSHIGNISMMLGRKLRWEPDTERFVDDEQANRMLRRSMRSPWQL